MKSYLVLIFFRIVCLTVQHIDVTIIIQTTKPKIPIEVGDEPKLNHVDD